MEKVRLYNTLRRKKEIFKPIDPKKVGMYVCGPTVYDLAHVGNARPIVVFDVLWRLLKCIYPKVTYVRNITDIDDKIIDAAAKNKESIDSLTSRTIRSFHQDMSALNALDPDIEPRATEHISEMILLIKKLIDNGNAYEAAKHVLFHVPSMSDYGKLSKRKSKEMIAGARVEVAPYKKDPADFVLWKPSEGDQPGWKSPWGYGRPGWHIECSAMSTFHLGKKFDIHGGGLDLIFPHHENEIAQSQCAHGKDSFANYWLHNGFLTVSGEKMSKSLNNFIIIREALKKFSGEVIRFFMLLTHYRQPLDWTTQGLERAGLSLDRIYNALWKSQEVSRNDALKPSKDFLKDLCDDLNTPLATSRLFNLANNLNKAKNVKEKKKIKSDLIANGNLLGILEHNPEKWFQDSSNKKSGIQKKEEKNDEQWIQNKINARNQARAKKDFVTSDQIREELLSKGIVLEDDVSGTKWKRVDKE